MQGHAVIDVPWVDRAATDTGLGDNRGGPGQAGTDLVDHDLEAFLEEYRRLVGESLTGLTEEQARRRLVPSRTTLLGLVKHLTFVERVWFEEAVTGTPRTRLGLPESVDDSFLLTEVDTIASVSCAHREACEGSRRAAARLALDDVVSGHRAGLMTLRWIYLQCLREFAHHCGHADILREQILAGPSKSYTNPQSSD